MSSSSRDLADAIDEAFEIDAPSEAHVMAARLWLTGSRHEHALTLLVGDHWLLESHTEFYNGCEQKLSAWLAEFWDAATQASPDGPWRGLLLWQARGLMNERPSFRTQLFELTKSWANLPLPAEAYGCDDPHFPSSLRAGDLSSPRTYLDFVIRDAVFPDAVPYLAAAGWVTGSDESLPAYLLSTGSLEAFEYVMDTLATENYSKQLCLDDLRKAAVLVQGGYYTYRDGDTSADVLELLDSWGEKLKAGSPTSPL